MTVNVLVIGAALLFLLMGQPIAFVLANASVVAFLIVNPEFLQMIPQRLFGGISFFPLLAIPFFVLAGELMTKGNITDALIKLAYSIVGRIRGGLAHTVTLCCMFFGGITGSAPAETSAIGSVMIPAMVKQGYSLDFSTAITAAASTMGPIIPPSIIFVMYSAMTNVSIGGMFAAGIIPGVLIGVGIMCYTFVISDKRGFPKRETRETFSEIMSNFKSAIFPLGMPLIVVGGIFGGVFTATEAAAVSVAYALFVGLFILRTLRLSDLPSILMKAGITTSIVLFVVGASGILGWVITVQQVPKVITELLMRISTNPYVFLLIVNILLLVWGMFMDAGVGVILLAPILTPVAVAYGINPIHFGIVMCLNLTIGHGTPPFGVCLFVASAITGLTIERISKAIFPFLLVEVLILLIVTYFPFLSLWIPKLMGYF